MKNDDLEFKKQQFYICCRAFDPKCIFHKCQKLENKSKDEFIENFKWVDYIEACIYSKYYKREYISLQYYYKENKFMTALIRKHSLDEFDAKPHLKFKTFDELSQVLFYINREYL